MTDHGPMTPVRCLVVDDEHFVRRGLADGLAAMDGVEVAGEAGSVDEALSHAGAVDLVLLDLGLPGTCRRTATSTIIGAWPDVRVLVITAHATGPDVVQAFGEGASGYVTKNIGPLELAEAIRTVAAGGSYVTPELAGHLLNADCELTDQEQRVLRLVGRGLTNIEVGAKLFIASRTVDKHLGAIRRKAGLLNRARSEITQFALLHDPGCQLTPEEHDRAREAEKATRRSRKARP